MKIIMFTTDNAKRFWSHSKQTTLRAAGASGQPRFKVGELASLRIWLGAAYRSKTYEFGTGRIRCVNSIKIEGNTAFIDDRKCTAQNRATLAQRDGFGTWEELKTALNLHHGGTMTGFRYWFEDIELHPESRLFSHKETAVAQ
jgi:hypothetical protein